MKTKLTIVILLLISIAYLLSDRNAKGNNQNMFDNDPSYIEYKRQKADNQYNVWKENIMNDRADLEQEIYSDYMHFPIDSLGDYSREFVRRIVEQKYK